MPAAHTAPNSRPAAITAEAVDEALRFPAAYQAFREYRELDAAALYGLQRHRLSLLLRRSLRTVPALRTTGIEADTQVDPFDVLARLPLTDKPGIRARYLDYCADDIEPAQCRAALTSGTSGVPLRVIQPVDALVHQNALTMLRYHHWADVPFDRKILRPFRISGGDWLEYTSLASGFSRIAEFGLLDHDALRPGVAQRCREFQPDLLFGTPSRLLDLRDLLAASPLPPVRVVITSGERVTEPVRQTLSDTFGAPVRDVYALREAGTVAAECTAGRYHVESARLWLEVVDPQGNPVPDGVAGEIVVTDLLNTAMPFIRYRTGDRGALAAEHCGCGTPAKVLRFVAGRSYGEIRLPSGAGVDAQRVVKLLEKYPVQRLQVVQDDASSLRVLVQPLGEFTATHAGEIERAAVALLPEPMTVRVRAAVDADFVSARGGKSQAFISMSARGGDVDGQAELDR
jgi:phenylacetate-CoA ligase